MRTIWLGNIVNNDIAAIAGVAADACFDVSRLGEERV